MIPTTSVASPAVAQLTSQSKPQPADAKVKAAAKQFEAMFMGEMLRLARPRNKAAGVFSEGQAEKTWTVFMDQALGQAVAAQGGLGLTNDIEAAMRPGQAAHSGQTK